MTDPFSRLPMSVEIGGRSLPIDPDFRLMVHLETAILRERQKAVAQAMLRFYRGRLPTDLDGAVAALLWFYRCGRAEPLEGGAAAGRNRCYDFRQDADALYASFRQAYHIDLHQDALHWWAFRTLMFGLPEDTPFSRAVHIRTVDTTDMSREDRKRYSKLKRRFALSEAEKHMTLEERDAWMKAYVARRFAELEAGNH